MTGTLPKNPDTSRITWSPNSPGISTGMPLLDMLSGFLFSGTHAAPIPGAGQSVYDSYLQRQRSREYISLMQRSVGQSLLAQRVGGIDTTSMLGSVLTMVAGNPDGIMDSSLLRAFNGGNPVRAMMGLNANFTGQTMGMAFGTNTNVNTDQVRNMFQTLQNSLYKTRRISDNDFSQVAKDTSSEIFKILDNTGGASDIFNTLKMSDGSFDFEKFKRESKKYAETVKNTANKELIKAYEDVLTMSNGVMDFKTTIGSEVITRTDPRKMMGYQFDDISKSLAVAADLGLFSAKGGVKDMGSATKNFAASAPGLLRAVSDLTGSTTMESAMGELNALLGVSQLNLSDAGQSDKMENLVRRFKGAAKAAGISVEAVKSILDTAKQLSMGVDSLGYVGGATMMETSIRSVQQTSALVAALGPEWARRQGGTLGVQQTSIGADMQMKAEPISAQFASLAAMINSSTTLSADKKEQMLQELNNAAQDPAQLSSGRYNAFLDRTASQLGISRARLQLGMTSTGYQQVGYEFLEERARSGRALNLDSAGQSMTVARLQEHLMLNARGDGAVIMENGKQLTPEQRYSRFLERLGKGETGSKLLAEYGFLSPEVERVFSSKDQVDKNIVHYMTRYAAAKFNPKYAQQLAQQQAVGSAYATESSYMAKHLAKLQTPFLDNVAQALVSGSFDEGFDSIKDFLISDPAIVRSSSILSAAKRLRGEGTSATFYDLYQELLGGAGDSLKDDQIGRNLTAVYLTPEEQQKALARRKAFTKEGFENFEAIGKALTLNQIKGAATKWEGSEAEKQGLSRDAVTNAFKFAEDTGLSSIFDKYGDEKFESIFPKIGNELTLDEAARIAREDAKANIIKDTNTDLEKELIGPERKDNKELIGLLDSLGIGALNRDSSGKITGINTGKVLSALSETGKAKLTGGAKAAAEQLGNNPLFTSSIASMNAAEAVSDTALSKAKSDDNLANILNDLQQVLGDQGGAITKSLSLLTETLSRVSGT